MKKDVHKHLFASYGNLPLLWFGIATQLVQTAISRVVVVVILADITTNIAAQNIVAAKTGIILFVILYIAGTLIGAAGELMAIKTTDGRYKSLLLNFYKKLTGKDLSFYRDSQTGALTASFRQHLDGTMGLIRLLRGDVVRMFVSLVFPVAVLFAVNWIAGLVAAVFVIVQSWYIFWSSNSANKYRKPAQTVYKKLTGEVADELTNAVAFKSSGNEAQAESAVAHLADQEAKLFWQRHKASLVFDLPRVILTGLGISAAYYVSVLGSAGTPQAVGLFVLIFTYMFQLLRSVSDLPDLVARYDEHVARVHPTLELLTDAHETVLDPLDPKPMSVSAGAIDVRNVAFSYKTKAGQSEVFKDLTISIRGGEHVGIVGLSGAGKSTFAGLLMRFDDVNAGSISIDGTDIREVRQSDLRKNIAYVPQEPLLFHRSIRENIAYFRKDATEEEIVAAAKVAHAHGFIEKVPEGYGAMVGERGVKLSGGQKQRIAIARSILKNAPVMIFDEATSALDSESEQIIYKALPDIIKDRTAIVIAHRLSTVARMDRIIVMHDGEIAESGSHEELLARKGRYYSLWQKQTSDSE